MLRSVVLLSAMAAALAMPAHAGAQPLRVMTYNIRWASPVESETGRYTRRVDIERIAVDIRRARADIVALQEAQVYDVGGRRISEPRRIARKLGWPTGGVLFAAGTPPARWCVRPDGEAVTRRVGKLRGICVAHGNAILSRFSLSEPARVELPRFEGFEGRNLIGATLAPLGLRVYTTHLERWTGAAACQLAEIAGLGLAERPSVLAADLNLSADTVVDPAPCDGVPPRPLDLLATAGWGGPPSGLPTYPAFAPVEAIDHVFVSPDVTRIRAGRAQNCRAGLCSSDHRPYYADVRTG